MGGAMRRFVQSRGVRKYRKNRVAVAALGVVGVYLLVALWVTLGGVSLQGVNQRVLPNQWPGAFLEEPAFEQRVKQLRERAAEIERVFGDAAESDSPERTLERLSWAERVIADVSFEEQRSLATAVTDARSALEGPLRDLQDALEFYEFAKQELEKIEAGESRMSREEVEGVIAEQLPLVEAARPVVEDRLVALEGAIEELMPTPGGYEGFVYFTRVMLGSDSQGRSIFYKGVYSIKVAFQIGFVVALVCVLIGTVLGAAAAFYGGWVDYVVMWIISTLSSIPYIVLLAVVVFMFLGSDLFDNASRPGLALVPVYTAMGLTFWISTGRVIRGEVMKIKELEYVQAATSIGFGRPYILLKHVIPNTLHLVFINFSLLFIGAIKSEVILSFLGLGVKGQPSWGTMISQGKDDVSAFFFWEVLTATVLMFGLVYAFNIVSDALQDAFDPKHV